MRKVETVLRVYEGKEYQAKFLFGLGNLTRDGELRFTAENKPVYNGGIAFTTYKEGGERTAEFYDLEAWDKAAERLAKFPEKGTELVIYGKLMDASYTNKEGVEVKKEKLRVENFQVIKRNKTTNTNGESETKVEISGYVEVDTDDDIPF